ncbi:MAG TPA: flagellar motor switch protein FliN [Candidatus Baltobacteraceae bacterium]|nr:flagellar motor switch protein FliN [Candidatus Baltobacteraceae bacterium]
MKSFAEISSLPKASAFFTTWTEAFADVLEKVAGAKHPAELMAVESVEPGALSAAESGLSIVFTAGGSIRGEQTCRVAETDAKLLAQLLMGETPGAASPLTDDDRDAAAEVFRQVSGQVAIDLAGKWSAQVSLAFDAARPAAWEPAAKAAICITTPAGRKPVIVLALQDSLLAALTEAPAPAKAAPAPKESPKADPEPAAKDPTGANLDLLLDIELEATIRFGQREMLLREVLDLRAGSVIELERHVEEPAELLVAGRPVARGEVVVVEGNYGLRITEILSPRQRYEAVGK